MEEENKVVEETTESVVEEQPQEPVLDTPQVMPEVQPTPVEVQPVEANPVVEPQVGEVQPQEPKKSNKKKVITIVIISIVVVLAIAGVIVYLLLSGAFDAKDNKPQDETTTTETTTTQVPRVGKELTLYVKTTTYTDVPTDNSYNVITDKKSTSNYNNIKYDYKPFTISCENTSCEYVTSSYLDNLIVIKDGKYYSMVNMEDKLLGREIGKKLVNEGNKIVFTEYGLGKTASGDVYAVAEIGKEYSGNVVVFNATKGTSSEVIKDSDLYCGDGEEGCPETKYTDYYFFSIGESGPLKVYNIVDQKWEDFTIPSGSFAIGNETKSYYATQYINNKYTQQDGTILDTKGNVVMKNLNYVGSYEDKIYVQKNDALQKLDINLNEQKQITNITETFMVGKDFVLVNMNGKIKLFDGELNELTTFIDDYDTSKYYIHTALSGWFTDHGKNGIYIVIEDITDPDMYGDGGQGHEYYYIPTTKETGKIATEIGGYAKPVLYLYPKKETNVKVTFDKPEMLTTTYPKYKDSWNVKVKPNGDMYDKDGKYYYALYWEEQKNHEVSFNTGFYVEKDNAINFLEEKLTTIGLNKKERNEFIMYWLPILEKNGKSLVYFELTEEREKYSPITITPAPDSLLRIAMHVKKVDTKVDIKEQKLKTFKRKGFTAVEWGGVIH